MQLLEMLIARDRVLQVLRCSYWLNQQRTEAWLVAQVDQRAGNMAGTMMGGCSATLLDQGCGIGECRVGSLAVEQFVELKGAERGLHDGIR